MMLLCGQSNRVWHYLAGKYGSVGLLISPSYYKKVPLDDYMPFVIDNGAFIAWRDKEPWDEEGWKKMLNIVAMKCRTPLWAAVPDVVADRAGTISKWHSHAAEIKKRGWSAAFCVQDGMTPEDVPSDADVIFVGGSDDWKFPNLKMWTEHFPRVHCARVNSIKMIQACDRLGCESVDGTGWFRDPSRKDKVPAIRNYVEGHRDKNIEFEFGLP